MADSPIDTARVLTKRRVVVVLFFACVFAVAAVIFSLAVGPTKIDFSRFFSGDDSERDVFKILGIRTPRAMAALIVGGALSIAGVIFQALIHNPLASPYVLGVSAGGSLGAVIAIALGSIVIMPFAFVGAVAAILLVYVIARTRGRVPSDTLLLAGVVVNAFFSAGIMFVTYTTGSDRTLHIMRWLVGGLPESYETSTLLSAAATTLIVAGIALASGRGLNLLALGDDVADRLGVRVPQLRTRLFILGSLLTAAAVAISGPIGFVGLIVPHILRLMIGPDHRLLLPASMFVGGGFLAAADTLAGVVWHVPLPVGLITAFIGGPFFIVLMLVRDRRRAGHGV